MNNFKSVIRTIFAVIFGMYSFGGIILTIKHSKIEFILLTVFLGVISFRLLHKTLQEYKAKKSADNIDKVSSLHHTVQTIAPTVPYTDINNILYRTDNQPISDDKISDLMQRDYENALKQEAESTNIKFKRTEREEELCFQFMINQSEEISKHTKSFEDMYRLAGNEQDLNKRIELLQNTITLFEKERQWFYKTVGGKLFFQDFYEHLHNSSNDDFSYIDSVEDSLDHDLYIRDDVIPEIMQVITSSGELMQRDIYKHLPDIPKSIIQQTIRELEKDNLIVRTKRGNSYLLSLGSCPYKV